MNADKVLCIVRLVLEWITIGCAACAMVCDMIEPGSANGLVWAFAAVLSGVRCVMDVSTIKRIEYNRDEWMGAAYRALGILNEIYEKNKHRLEMDQTEENDLK